LVLKSANDNRERHNLIEEFMLINDTATVAVEVPIWFWEKKLDIGICGHIDILQIRNNLIYILDYKPSAIKEKFEKVSTQLYLYALGLSFRTGINLDKIRCAWFDDKNYFEFEPIKIKYQKEVKC